MPNVVTTLTYPCPQCDGACEQDVDETGAPVGSVTLVECSAGTQCEQAYVNGQHADALAAAWEEWAETQFERSSNPEGESVGGGSADPYQHQLEQARKLK